MTTSASEDAIADGSRLTLRVLRSGDAFDVLEAFQSNADMQRQGSVATLQEATKYISDLIGPDSPHRPWALTNQGRLIGLVCVSVDEKNRVGWFWYWMTASARGRGWMSRAAATVAEWALSIGGVERLELGHRVNNPTSAAVACAAGFIAEGTQREKFLIEGRRLDVVTYGRLRSDPHPGFRLIAMGEHP